MAAEKCQRTGHLESAIAGSGADRRRKENTMAHGVAAFVGATGNEYVWVVRVVGIIQLGSRVSGAAFGAGRPEFPFVEYSGVRGVAEPCRDGAGISVLRRVRGSLRAEKIGAAVFVRGGVVRAIFRGRAAAGDDPGVRVRDGIFWIGIFCGRSEEHTSELQSLR